MQSKDYKTIQIPIESYEILKEYCEAMNLKMGKFVGDLIEKSCLPLAKKPGKNVLRVDTNAGG